MCNKQECIDQVLLHNPRSIVPPATGREFFSGAEAVNRYR